MNVTKRIAFGLVGALIAAGSLMAQTPTQKREAKETRRDARQQERIAKGVQSGQLTPKEAGKLEKQEARIDKQEAKAAADGKVTKQEQKKINREQNRESKRIYRKKHNDRTTTAAK